MKLQSMIQFIAVLMKEGFSGRIIIDFHKGDISSRIKKETVVDIE